MCVAWKISSEFPEVTRVLVMKQTGNRYVAWISVEDDNVYEFIKKYNKEKRVPMSTAQAKRTMNVDRKLVFHNVAANDAPKIEKWIGAERIQDMTIRGNTAFAVVKEKSYMEALLEKDMWRSFR